jgi:uncharacterized protein (TIGR02145 family)
MGHAINITDTTTGGTTYYWSFCSGNTIYNPVGVNIGNPGNLLNIPAYIFLVEDNSGCYSFITNGGTSSLIRYFHGSSYNNNPVSWTDLGTFGMLSDSIQGIRILKDNGQWICFINNNNRLARLNFGNSLANTPTAIILGPYSMLNSAHCLEILNENGSWIGYLVCTWGNKLVRLSFGSSLLNDPVLTDLGNFGGILNMPRVFSMAKENGNWYTILANYGNSTHVRLNFGSSLFNDPTATSLGQVCGSIPLGGIVLLRDCNETTGFQQNYTANSSTANEIYRLNFPTGLLGSITGTPMGNIGNMNRPNEFSQIVRVGDTLFLYATNRQDYTLTRLKFLPCTNASIGSSTQYNPPQYSYNQTGTYNVQLFVDEGLATQASLCKNIVVVDPPTMNLGPDKTICQGSSTVLDAGPGFRSYFWSTGATTRTIIVGTAGTYWAQGMKYGCQASDTVHIFVMPQPVPTISGQSSVCSGTSGNVYTTESSMSSYIWTVSPEGIIASGSGTSSVMVTWNTAGSQTISVNYTNGSGCTASFPTVKNVTVNPRPVPTIWGLSPVCEGTTGVTYSTESFMTGYSWTVSAGGIITSGLLTNIITVTWNTAGSQSVSVTYTDGNGCTASQSSVKVITVNPSPVPALSGTSSVCAGTTGVAYTTDPLLSGYTWTVSPGGIITSGNTTNTIIVSWISQGVQTVTVNYTNFSGCTAQQAAIKNVTVNPLPMVSLGPDVSICTGQTVTFDAGACTGCTYQWDNITTGQFNLGNGQTYTTGIAGQYVATKTDVLGCAGRDTILLTINSQSPVSVNATPSINPVCLGHSVHFTATPVNGGSSPSYQWKVNGLNAGTDSSGFTYIPANNDLISCVLTSSELYCVTNNPATSNTVVMHVVQNNPVSLTISASVNPVCAGNLVHFNTQPVNGGLAPSYQWKVNGVNVGTGTSSYSYTPLTGDSIRCVMTSNLGCVFNNPASSNKIVMSSLQVPVVTFSLCFDSITTINAAAFKLKGGVPIGGTYSGPGVNSVTGIFTPSLAGVGTKTITYSYTNVLSCSSVMTKNIIVQVAPVFTCGNNLNDIRDNKVYSTVQIGTQCWMQKNLNYGTSLLGAIEQTDNCINEKYCYSDNTANCTLYGGLYQWDELMAYTTSPGAQGLCPPGWHVPTQSDWNTLFTFYQEQALAGKPLQDTIIMKFRAMESGVIYSNFSWSFKGFATIFWTSSSSGTIKAMSHGMNLINFSVSDYPANRSNAFAVRCVKD